MTSSPFPLLCVYGRLRTVADMHDMFLAPAPLMKEGDQLNVAVGVGLGSAAEIQTIRQKLMSKLGC